MSIFDRSRLHIFEECEKVVPVEELARITGYDAEELHRDILMTAILEIQQVARVLAKKEAAQSDQAEPPEPQKQHWMDAIFTCLYTESGPYIE